MSAFEVSEAHIDALVEARSWIEYTFTPRPLREMSDDEIGQMLRLENIRSLHYRYPAHVQPTDKARCAAYRFKRSRLIAALGGVDDRAVNCVKLIKAIHCYEYQSCEHPEWEGSAAHAYCKDILARLVEYLPGYADAPWGID